MYSEERPWGRFEVLAEEGRYKVKRLIVQPGQRISYQSHRSRSERWTVVSGKAVVIIEDTRSHLGPGDVIAIEKGEKHRLENQEDVPLVVIEVQLGDYLGEDDIRRYVDDYDRC